jgi:hypothetical protein
MLKIAIALVQHPSFLLANGNGKECMVCVYMLLKYPLIILRTEFPSNNKQSSFFFFTKKKLFSEAHIGYTQYLHIHIVCAHKTCQEKKRQKIHIHFPFESFIIIFCAKRVMGSYIICGIDGMETNGYIIMLYCVYMC